MINATVDVTAMDLVQLRRAFRFNFEGIPEALAKRGAARVRQNIYGQRYKHVALNPLYRRWKVKHGLDPRILIATGKYVESIVARKQNKTTWLVAPAAGETFGKAGRAMSTLGLWLEYGTKHMPARPHFRPEAARLQVELVQMGKRGVATIVKDIRAVRMVRV